MHTVINIINMTRSISLGCKTVYGFIDCKINEMKTLNLNHNSGFNQFCMWKRFI